MPAWYAAPRSDPAERHAATDDEPPLAPASLLRRAVAWALDYGVYLALQLAGSAIAALVIAALAERGSVSAGWLRLFQTTSYWDHAGATIAAILMHTVGLGFGGATFGKAILGIRVIRAGGAPCTFREAAIRSAALVVDGFLCFAVGALTATASPVRQRMGDRWAGTIVVDADNVPRGSARPISLGLVASALVVPPFIVAWYVLAAL